MSSTVVHKNYVIDLDIGCERYSIEARWVDKPEPFFGMSIAGMLAAVDEKDALKISETPQKEQSLRPYLVRHGKSYPRDYAASLDDLIALRDACQAMLDYFASEEDVEK